MAEGVAEARVKINGREVETDALAGVQVEQDMDQPDMAAATLNNTNDYKYSVKVNQGDAFEVNIGPTTDTPAQVFIGEVVGIEPIFDVSGESKVRVRAFNKLHRLTRGRKSRTFLDMTDGDIVTKVAQEYGLTPEIKGGVNIKHSHVYQADKSDFDFLLERAKRINYELFVVDKKLTFRKRDISVDSGIELKWGKDASGAEYSLQRFEAKLNSANQVKEVTVRGWDPAKSEAIIGKADSVATKLGSKDGPSAAASFGVQKASYEVPVYTVEEANAVAKSLLEDHALSYIVGEGQCKGHPKIKAGIVVKISADDTRFDGKYYITGATHVYATKKKGYLTMIRVLRNAECS